MPLFLRLFFFHTIHYRTSHHTTFYMMRQAFMSGAAVVSHGSHHIDVMRLVQARFYHGIGGLKVTVSSGIILAFLPNWDSNLRPTHQRL